ncbi:hypothetical protein LSS_10303 [Leptospira santarosai serovar Shermani str. LT 821]|uniref:Uncharacterized protein n=1 Tax=Leptospira santarosai serovar Shermani str. LT 821 TaxID=758847 RepID=K8Y8C3_9LEPT|nr:hypothetical protein LSS_10303 [Leptospira santarosai serovar Shermani str. LT 821]EPG84063.1 hypothetical protein LEP1GSC048_1857 [Leptospira santarosai serovar Shermani str. 1342KT]
MENSFQTDSPSNFRDLNLLRTNPSETTSESHPKVSIRLNNTLYGFTQNYNITGCPKFCFKTEIGLKINGTLFCREEEFVVKNRVRSFQKKHRKNQS